MIYRSGSVIAAVITLRNYNMLKPTPFTLAVCCIAALLLGCEGSSGFGQSFDSPNGKLNASATDYYGKGQVVREIRYIITDKSTGKTIWKHVEKSHGSNDPPLGAGFGNLELIQWSPDSAEVGFAIKCTDIVNATDWIAARTDESGGFAAGVVEKNGLRNVDRTKQQLNPPSS